MEFLWKTPETKKFAELFCEVFLIFFINILQSHPGRISFFNKGPFCP
jgi:hypothetical protein